MDQSFENLLEYLKRSRGFDVTPYKRTSLTRRITHRMQSVGVETFEGYQDYLEVHPDEFAQLFNTILINVTGFFRDEASWGFISSDVVPRILAGKAVGEPIRVWTAGCASGEEAFTAVMVFAEALGSAEARARVKVYATDLNEGDLNVGRQATYKPKDVEAVPAHLREKYFRQVGRYSVFDSDLRRLVVFGRHDLLQDSPISHIDLLLCRNTLMYFNAEAQGRVLQRFHFALNDNGFLFLGKAEMLLANSDLFTPLDIKRRVFVKNARHDAYTPSAFELAQRACPTLRRPTLDAALPAAALQSAPVAQLVIDTDLKLATANESGRRLFGLGDGDLGRPIADLPLAHRPIDLNAYVQQVAGAGRPVVLREVEWTPADGDSRAFDIQIVPLFDTDNRSLGVSASYSEVTQYKRLREDLQHVTEERETTHEELQTTNEELQSTVEELETTNEELQSTNEELETMNEELQSTNEELRSSNEALRQQSQVLDQVNGFWEAVMASMRYAIAIVDPEFKVLVWNSRASELWGLRPEEVRGRNFLSLDIGLPVDRVKQPIRACFADEKGVQPVVLPATNRRGKTIQCRVACSPLRQQRDRVTGVIVLMEEVQPQGGGS